jgi:2-polyprenyl-3-methyl-5-hydroxy-6-metoxy-1,4-benzoquinol methylase
MRVLDLAGGDGRHALAAAALGAQVLLVDRDEAALATAQGLADARHVRIETRAVDLEGPWPDFGAFDAVLLFNYLDRSRMNDVTARVAPRGVLMMETFLDSQSAYGWGPTRSEHLLRPGELARLVAPLVVLHGREVLEPVDANRWRAVAGVLASR